MSGLIASALKGALLRFQEPLQLVSVSVELTRGHTARTESTPVGFYGAISEADVWHSALAPGGEMSSSYPVLVVAEDAETFLLDEDDDAEPGPLTIDRDDIVTNRAGVRHKVVKKLNSAADFGLVMFELTEAL